MECVTGVPFAYDPGGVLEQCAVPLEVTGFGQFIAELLYLIDRLPTYVEVLGGLLGVLLFLLAALVAKQLMT